MGWALRGDIDRVSCHGPHDPAVQSGRTSTIQTDMTLTFVSFTIEITRGHFYADHAGIRAVFVEFRSGFPFRDFEKRRSETDLEL